MIWGCFVKIRKVIGENVLSFKYIEFTIGDHPVIQVIGENLDEKKNTETDVDLYSAGNGVGKTNLYHLITEAQYSKNIVGIKKTYLANMYLDSPMKIQIHYTNGDILTYTNNSCDVTDAKGRLVVRGRKEVSAYFEDKIPFNLYTALTYASPDYHIPYFSDTDKYKKEFIQLIFEDLQKYSEPLPKVQNRIKEVKATHTELEGAKKVIEETLQTKIPDKKEEINIPDFNIPQLERQRDIIKEKIAKNKAAAEWNTKQKQKEDKLKKRLESLIQYKNATVTFIDATALQEDISILKHEIKALSLLKGKDKCPTCGQSLENTTNKLTHLEAEYKRKVSEYNEIVEANKKAKEIQEKQNELTKIEKELQETQKDYYEVIDFQDLEQELIDIEATIREQRQQRQDMEKKLQEIRLHNARVDELLLMKEKQLARLNTVEKDLDYTSQKLRLLDVLEKTFSPTGILQHKIPERLQVLNAEINRELAMFTNQFTLNFVLEKGKVTEKLLKKGKEYPINNCSKGEYTRIMLALLFATKKILKVLKNIDLNFLFLDEVFGSLDNTGKQLLMSRVESLDITCFLISHSHHSQKYPTIEITKENNISTAKFIN